MLNYHKKEEFKDLIRENFKNNKQLAKELRISEVTISNWLTYGLRDARFKHMLALSKVLKIDIMELEKYL